MDNLSPNDRSLMMGRIRGADTRPELRVRRMLHGLGFRFRLHRRDLPGRPDIVLPGRRAAVFVHGCFWHDHAGCRYATKPKSNTAFWAQKFARNRERDAAAEWALGARGWTVLVVWECELRNPDALRARLDGELRQLDPRPRRSPRSAAG